MLLEPPVDMLTKKIGNPYKLAVLVGKRAKFLQRKLTEDELAQKPEVSRAIEEVNAGTVVIDSLLEDDNITE